MKLMVIDGNSIVNRAYYGIRPLSTRDGLYTHAIYGFLTTLQRLLDEEQPQALCVTFDRKATRPTTSSAPSAAAARHPAGTASSSPATRTVSSSSPPIPR